MQLHGQRLYRTHPYPGRSDYGPVVIMAAGGFTHINEVMLQSADKCRSLVSGAGAVFTPEYIFSFFLLLTIGLACAPHVINNILSVKDGKTFKWAPLVAFVIYAFVMFLLKFAGFAGIVLVNEALLRCQKCPMHPTSSLSMESRQQCQICSYGNICGYCACRIMSTTDRLMLTIGTYFSWDIYKKILKPDAPDKQVLLVSQISVFIAAAITLILAISPRIC